MRPSVILRAVMGAPAREVPFSGTRLAALLATNDRLFADAAALLRHLRRGHPVFMAACEYRLRPEDTFRLAA